MRVSKFVESSKSVSIQSKSRRETMRRLLLLLALLAAPLAAGLPAASAGLIEAFTEQVSPESETNATEPSVAVDRSDGTVYVAWQATGTHVARSDDGGRTFTQLAEQDPIFGRDSGDVHVRIGGLTDCTALRQDPMTQCRPGTHRVYVSSLTRLPDPLQAKVAYTDDRGATWTHNNIAATNPSFIDRPWMAVSPGPTAETDRVYISYHDFSISHVYVATSTNGARTFGPSVDVMAQNPQAAIQSFCNTVPSDIEVDPETGEVYVQWITADLVANTQGCNITQNENFHEVWVAHSP